VIPAGREIELFIVKGARENASNFQRLFGGEDAEIEITYASVYEEQWKLRGLKNPPQKLDD
jgi:TorA maturation chaperone TorD